MRNIKTEDGRNTIITIFFFASLFALLCLIVPVWQGSVSSSLNARLKEVQGDLKDANEDVRILKAKIEKESSPEYLIQRAEVVNIDFCQVSANDTVRFAMTR